MFMIEGYENIKPNLRVCILNWNGGDTLNQCVNSILSNNANNFRVTVIDNCSTDGSIEKLDSQIELIQLEKNYGFSAGYNLGLNRCLSDNDEYIILLNYDTTLDSNFISSITDQITKNGPDYIYGAKILYDDNRDLIWYGGGVTNLSKGIISHIGIRENHENHSLQSETDYVTGCCMIIHKDNYLKLGGFDQSFFMYNEDVDLCLRAKKIGVYCIYVPSAIVYHKVSFSTGGNYSIKKILLKSKSSYTLFRKYFTAPKAFFLLFKYFIRSLFNMNSKKKHG